MFNSKLNPTYTDALVKYLESTKLKVIRLRDDLPFTKVKQILDATENRPDVVVHGTTKNFAISAILFNINCFDASDAVFYGQKICGTGVGCGYDFRNVQQVLNFEPLEECPVCFGKYEKAQSCSQCGNVICLGCYKKLHQNPGQFNCPFCREAYE